MYPPAFDYHRAESVSDALSLLADLPDATVLAGGHALLPRLKNGDAEPGAVVDVSDLPALSGLEVEADALVVGAATTYSELLEATAVNGETVLEAHAPAVADATRAVGDRQIRNRGTIGGNLAEAHPESDLPPAALVADASVQIRGPDGERTVPASAFVTGAFESAVGDDELVTAVRLPRVDGDRGPDEATGGAYSKQTHPTSGYAMVGVAARIGRTDGKLTTARVATTGVSTTPTRLSSVESSLTGMALEGHTPATDDRISELVADAAADIPEARRRGDVHASAEYRSSVLPTVVERAVLAALADADAQDTAGSSGGESR